ncbi:hypothetical protein BU15DRAFT_71366 [Melanogaster broomeanus]|nr:hypothetical protein BU15DRAFT_71366 [Melanogaster broomeanus]
MSSSFGETGVGKSSIINLILGVDNRATTSRDAAPCTTGFTPYDVALWGTTYRLWDTPGLNEASRFKFSVPPSERALKKFLRDKYFARRDPSRRILLSRWQGSQRHGKCLQNFRQAHSPVRGPLVIAVTDLENMQPAMDTWWVQNGKKLEKLGLEFDGHACVTCLSSHSRWVSAQDDIRDLLKLAREPTTERDPSFLKGGDGCIIA